MESWSGGPHVSHPTGQAVLCCNPREARGFSDAQGPDEESHPLPGSSLLQGKSSRPPQRSQALQRTPSRGRCGPLRSSRSPCTFFPD